MDTNFIIKRKFEEKYIPAMEGLSMEEKAGIAASQKKLSERRFERFQAGI